MERYQQVWTAGFPADDCKYARRATVLLVSSYIATRPSPMLLDVPMIAEAIGMNAQTVQHCINYLVNVNVLKKIQRGTYEWVWQIDTVPVSNVQSRRPMRLAPVNEQTSP
jgi:hypothetical protein